MKKVKSKHGEGIGGPIQESDDPDAPSFDPATHATGTDKKIRTLMEEHAHSLTPWEIGFLSDIYGVVPLTRRQHVTVAKIFRKYVPSSP